MKTFIQDSNGTMIEVETGGTWVDIGSVKALQAKLDAALKDGELIEAADRAMRADEEIRGLNWSTMNEDFYWYPFLKPARVPVRGKTLRAALEAMAEMGKS